MDKNITEQERQDISIAKAKERFARQQLTKEHRKYVIYYQQERNNKNQAHSHFDGKIFRTDDPYLYLIYPPNGFGCNCVMSSLSERQFKNLNGIVLDVKEYVNLLLDSGAITIEDVQEMEKFDPRK